MVGLVVSKSDVDTWAGSIGRDLDQAMQRITKFKTWLDAQQDTDLTALGYSAGDIANLRSAYVDAGQLAALFTGVGTLAVAKDFRTFLRRVWGFGAL